MHSHCPAGVQLPVGDIEKIPGPVTPEGPKDLPGRTAITQDQQSGPLVNETPESRGL